MMPPCTAPSRVQHIVPCQRLSLRLLSDRPSPLGLSESLLWHGSMLRLVAASCSCRISRRAALPCDAGTKRGSLTAEPRRLTQGACYCQGWSHRGGCGGRPLSCAPGLASADCMPDASILERKIGSVPAICWSPGDPEAASFGGCGRLRQRCRPRPHSLS